jgi:drug/metabolite transporter (DMT)-like permease
MRPDDLLVFRTSIAAAILVAWLGLKSPRSLRIRRADILPLALLGAVGLALNQGFYYLSLTMVSVGYSLLLQYLAPVHLMIYGALSKTERMTGAKLMAGATAIFGCVLMVLGQKGGIARVSTGGTLCALASGMCFAFYTAFGKRLLKNHEPRTMLAYAFLSASLMWSSIRPLWKIDWTVIDRSTWVFFIYLATVATILPFALYSASLRHLEASRSSLTSMLEPVVATSIAWGWLGEKMEPTQMVGAVAVLGGILLLQLEPLARARRQPSSHSGELMNNSTPVVSIGDDSRRPGAGPDGNLR